MAKLTTFTYRRGEPITVDIVVDDPGSYDPPALTLEMKLKPALYGAPPEPSVEAVATFTVVYTAAAGSEPAFWRGTIAPDALPAGTYVTDGEFLSGSSVIGVTDPVLIQLNETVTPA